MGVPARKIEQAVVLLRQRLQLDDLLRTLSGDVVLIGMVLNCADMSVEEGEVPAKRVEVGDFRGAGISQDRIRKAVVDALGELVAKDIAAIDADLLADGIDPPAGRRAWPPEPKKA